MSKDGPRPPPVAKVPETVAPAETGADEAAEDEEEDAEWQEHRGANRVHLVQDLLESLVRHGWRSGFALTDHE